MKLSNTIHSVQSIRLIFFALFLCCVSSCDSCSNSGTTITGNPTLPITIGRVSDAGQSEISIPLRIFGETEDVLDVSSLDVYVNDTARVSNLNPSGYLNTDSQAVEITLSSLNDGDELTFIINNSVDEYTYRGTASTDADTEATSDDAGNVDTGNTYTIDNFYGLWTREPACAAPDDNYSSEISWLNAYTLIIGGNNCDNDLYFYTGTEQPASTTSYSVSGDNLTINNSILGITTLENVIFSGDTENECINGYQFSGWEGDIELTYYYNDPGEIDCVLVPL